MENLTRRELFAIALASSVSPMIVGLTRASGANLDVISAVADMLSKCADAMTKLADSIAHVTKLGTQGFDAVAARKAHAQLIDLRKDLEDLVASTNMPMLRSINAYIAEHNRDPKPSPFRSQADWNIVNDRVSKAALRVREVLDTIDSVSNDFVLQDAYSALQRALNGRVAILTDLRKMEPPVEAEELKALQTLADQYQRLSDETLKASSQLAAYVASLK
jgi:hypothetical protein